MPYIIALIYIIIINDFIFLKRSNSENLHNIKIQQLLPDQVEQNVTLHPQFVFSNQMPHNSAGTNLVGLSAEQWSASVTSTPSPQSVLNKLMHPPLNCPLTVDSQTLDRTKDKTKHDAVQTIGRSDSLSIGMEFTLKVFCHFTQGLAYCSFIMM